jgi:hypothetical protein
MVLPSFFPAELDFGIAGPEEAKNHSGEMSLRLIQIRLATLSLAKITTARQANSPQAQIADSSSANAVSFSSARTTKRFPSSRCASATKLARPLESLS